MDKSNSVKYPIVPGTKLSKDEAGTKVDETLLKQVVGNLVYLTTTRPDLMYRVSLISRFMSCPTESHWLATKIILRYYFKVYCYLFYFFSYLFFLYVCSISKSYFVHLIQQI